MRFTVILFLLWMPCVSFGQLTHTKIIISSENNSSVFPLFHSQTNPKVAATINKSLQMVSFKHINVEKDPKLYEDQERYSTWNFGVNYSNPRLLHVRTDHFFPKQSMNGSDNTESTNFLFDPLTGDLISPLSFVNNESVAKIKVLQKERLTGIIKKAHANLVKKYSTQEYKDALPNLDATLAYVDNTIESNTLSCIENYFNLEARTFTFYHGWPDGDFELIPELENGFTVTLNETDLKTLTTTDVWSYYITQTNNAVPQGDPIAHVWSGVIGAKTPVTFTLRRIGDYISGVEVYDNYGGAITLFGEIKGNSFVLYEQDENEKRVAYFEVTSSNGKLSGVWKKMDGSKILPFKATIGATGL